MLNLADYLASLPEEAPALMAAFMAWLRSEWATPTLADLLAQVHHRFTASR